MLKCNQNVQKWVWAYLEGHLEAGASHAEAHGVHVDVVRESCLGVGAGGVVPVGGEVLYVRRGGVYVFIY